MRSALNMVTIIGYLGQDPELRFTQAGIPVANLSVAVTDRFKDSNGEKQEHTNWFRVVAWNKTAEISQEYLHKGDRVALVGSLKSRDYEIDGQKKNVIEIVADSISLIQSATSREMAKTGVEAGVGEGGDLNQN